MSGSVQTQHVQMLGAINTLKAKTFKLVSMQEDLYKKPNLYKTNLYKNSPEHFIML